MNQQNLKCTMNLFQMLLSKSGLSEIIVTSRFFIVIFDLRNPILKLYIKAKITLNKFWQLYDFANIQMAKEIGRIIVEYFDS